MSEQEEKIFLEKMKRLKEELDQRRWPIMGGLLVKKSHCCGVSVANGIWREVCSKCGKAHADIVYR